MKKTIAAVLMILLLVTISMPAFSSEYLTDSFEASSWIVYFLEGSSSIYYEDQNTVWVIIDSATKYPDDSTYADSETVYAAGDVYEEDSFLARLASIDYDTWYASDSDYVDHGNPLGQVIQVDTYHYGKYQNHELSFYTSAYRYAGVE